MRQSIGFIGNGGVTKILLQGFENGNVKFSMVIVTQITSDVIDITPVKLIGDHKYRISYL